MLCAVALHTKMLTTCYCGSENICTELGGRNYKPVLLAMRDCGSCPTRLKATFEVLQWVNTYFCMFSVLGQSIVMIPCTQQCEATLPIFDICKATSCQVTASWIWLCEAWCLQQVVRSPVLLVHVICLHFQYITFLCSSLLFELSCSSTELVSQEIMTCSCVWSKLLADAKRRTVSWFLLGQRALKAICSAQCRGHGFVISMSAYCGSQSSNILGIRL